MAKIALKSVSKVFGARPERALQLLEDGTGCEDIRRLTGLTVALHNINLEVQEGTVCVVMGLSGSGKSTLIRLINRLILPTSGDVLIGGKSILDKSEADILELRRRKISMVFQNFALLPHRTALANAGYGLELRGDDRKTAAKIARSWIEAVGLQGFEDAYPAELSGGMQQRVGLARALATNPEILLMDEPYSALDPLIRREMQDQLIALQTRLRKTLVFITHDLFEALRLGDKIVILRDGAVVQEGPPGDIVDAPADAYVRAFIKAMPTAATEKN